MRSEIPDEREGAILQCPDGAHDAVIATDLRHYDDRPQPPGYLYRRMSNQLKEGNSHGKRHWC